MASVGLVEVIALLGAFLGHVQAQPFIAVPDAVHIQTGTALTRIRQKWLVIDSQSRRAVGKDRMIVHARMQIGSTTANLAPTLELVTVFGCFCKSIATTGSGL